MTRRMKVKEICYCGLMAAFISICSWISVPIGQVPITLQTFGMFIAVGLLGGKLGTISILVYTLLGAAGVPVFAGFSGGIGAIVSSSGGYLIGFIFAALVMWVIQHFLGNGFAVQIISMAVGLLVLYTFGTLWFMFVYTRTSGAVSFITVLGWCVFPFILPDAVKLVCAAVVAERMKKHVSIQN